MKLSLPQPYEIFKEPFEIELPDFTIITGLNGSGKSQLLKVLENKNKQNNIDTKASVTIDGNPILNPYLYRYDNTKFGEQEKQFKIDGYNSSSNGQDIRTNIENQYRQYNDIKRNEHAIPKYIQEIAIKANKDISCLTIDDFTQHISLWEISTPNFIGHDFARLFRLYLYKKEHNQYIEFQHSKGLKQDIYCYSEEEFKKVFDEPPWEFINQVLTKYNSDYRIIPPSQNLDRDDKLELEFNDRITQEKIGLDNLSSGEKVLMALTLAAYNSGINSVTFPQLLLLDEPDAPLHPTMTQQFLNVIQDVFVKERGVKVIMTTHSPTTVALVPKGSLYVIEKPERILKEISKDDALKLLTKDIPFLSVKYNKAKFVVVEAQIDGYFYQSFFEKLISFKRLDDKIMFVFIPSRKLHKDGNAYAVEQAVKAFNENSDKDNSLYYGIIDWDLKDPDGNNISEEDNIKILGRNKRYSLENYIFDPLYLAAFFLDINYMTKADLDLTANENFWDTNFDESRLQIIADRIIESLPFFSEEKTENILVVVKYLNKKEIKIPQWYLRYNWHTKDHNNQADAKVKEIRNSLSQACGYQHPINTMKEDIIKLSIERLSEFIPIDIVELFKSIQEE